jgi:hypothetical protein
LRHGENFRYSAGMDERVIVDAVVTEKTYIGKVNFPVSAPEGLMDWLEFPDDLTWQADAMGLSHRDVTFLLGALRGKWGLQADLNPPDLAPRIGMSFDEIDSIVRELVAKNYAQF